MMSEVVIKKCLTKKKKEKNDDVNDDFKEYIERNNHKLAIE